MGRLIVVMFSAIGSYIVFPLLPILGQYSGKTVVVLQTHEFSANFLFAVIIAALAASIK